MPISAVKMLEPLHKGGISFDSTGQIPNLSINMQILLNSIKLDSTKRNFLHYH